MIRKGALIYISMLITVFYIIFNSFYYNDINSAGDYTKWGTDGYFTKNIAENGSSMNSLADGVFSFPSYIDSKDEFIKSLQDKYFSGNIKLKTSVAYIASTMLLGVQGITSPELSDSDWLAFLRLINELDVVWEHNALNCVNSFYQQNTNNHDIGLYVKCRSEPAMLFSNKETNFNYGIFRLSGSPLGVFSGMKPSLDVVGDTFFIDDMCASLSTNPKSVGYLPGFDVAVGPRYRSLRDMMVFSDLNLSSPLTTFRVIQGNCYYN